MGKTLEEQKENIGLIRNADPQEIIRYFDVLLDGAYKLEMQTGDPDMVWGCLYDRILCTPIEDDNEEYIDTYDEVISQRWPDFQIDEESDGTDKEDVITFINSFKRYISRLNENVNPFPTFDQWKTNKEINW